MNIKKKKDFAFSENQQFLNLIHLFAPGKFQVNGMQSFNEIPKHTISMIEQKLSEGSSPPECLCAIQQIFSFEEEKIMELKNEELKDASKQIFLIANIFGWLTNPQTQNSDSFDQISNIIINAWKISPKKKICSITYLLLHYISLFSFFPVSPEILQKYSSTLLLYKNPIFALKMAEILLKLAIKSQASPVYRNINFLFQDIFKLYPSIVMNYDFQTLIAICSSTFPVFDFELTSILSFIADLKPNQSINITFKNIAHVFSKELRSLLKSSKNDIKYASFIDNIYKFKDHLFGRIVSDRPESIPINFWPKQENFQLFPENINPLSVQDFSSDLSTSDLILDSQFLLLTQLQPLIHRTFSSVTTYFLHSFASEVRIEYHKPGGIPFFIFFISLLKNLQGYNIDEDLLETILLSPSLSHLYSIFYSTNYEFRITNTLRNMVFSFLIDNFPSTISSILDYSSKDSLLFIEHISRIFNMVTFTDINSFFSDKNIIQLAEVLKHLIFLIQSTFPSEDNSKPETITNGDDKMFFKCVNDSSNQSHETQMKLLDEEILNVNKEQKYQIYCKAWSSLFTFLISSLDDHHFSARCFASYKFTEMFLSFMYNPSYVKTIFQILRNFLIGYDPQKDDLSAIIKFCEHIFKHSLENSKEQELYTDLLSLIEDSMSHQPLIIKAFSVLTPSILSFLFSNPSPNVFKNTMRFMLSISSKLDDIFLEKDDMIKLSQILKANDLNSSTFLSMLLSIISGNKSPSINSNFPVKNPYAFIILFLSSNENILPIIELIERLCRVSVYNCIQCHIAEIDLFLIEMVHQYPNSFVYWNCTFNQIPKQYFDLLVFPLISRILSIRCSPQALSKFIDSAIPFHSNSPTEIESDLNFSPFAASVLDQINSLMADISYSPKFQYIYLPEARCLEFYNIPFEKFQNGFSFYCYILTDSIIYSQTQKQPLILQISDKNENKLQIYLSSFSIMSEFTTKSSSSSARMAEINIIDQWIIFSFIFEVIPGHEEATISFSLNKEQPMLFTVQNPNFSGPFLNIKIGGYIIPFSMNAKYASSNLNSEKGKTSKAIQPNVFNDSKQNVESIYGKPYLYVGNFYLFNKPVSNQISLSLIDSFFHTEFQQDNSDDQSHSYDNYSNLFNVLEEYHKNDDYVNGYIIPLRRTFYEYRFYEHFLPIFKHIDMAPPLFIPRIITLFNGINDDNFFLIIAKFLLETNPQKLTYSLYNEFFKLFTHNINSVLLSNILINFEIWFVSPAKELQRIISHWNKILFPTYFSIFVQTISFQSLLSSIRTFFYVSNEEKETIEGRVSDAEMSSNLHYTDPKENHEKIEEEVSTTIFSNLSNMNSENLQKRKRDKTLDIMFCRSQINQMMCQYAAVKFNESDIKALFSHIITLHDHQQVILFLKLMTQIFNDVGFPNSDDYARQLIFLTTRAPLFAETLRTIMTLAGNDRGKFIDFIMVNINLYHLKQPIFKEVLEVMKDFPEVSPIASMISLSLDEVEKFEVTKLLIEQIQEEENSDRILTTTSWYIWFSLLALSISKEKMKLVSHSTSVILIRSLNNTHSFALFDDIISFLNSLEFTQGANTTEFLVQIFIYIADSLIINPDKFMVSQMIYRCARCLFYTISDVRFSSNLISMFNSSECPFFEPNEDNFLFNDNSSHSNSRTKRPIKTFFDLEQFFAEQLNLHDIKNPSKIRFIFKSNIDKSLSSSISNLLIRFSHLAPMLNLFDNSFLIYLECFEFLGHHNEDQFNETTSNGSSFISTNSNDALDNSINSQLNSDLIQRGKINLDLLINIPKIENDISIFGRDYFIQYLFHQANYYSKILEKSVQAVTSVPDSTIAMSSDSLYLNTINRLRAKTFADNKWRKSQFNKEQIAEKYLRKSFQMSKDFTSSFFEYYIENPQIQIETTIIKEKPIFFSDAKLVNFFRTNPCKFIILSNRILVITSSLKKVIYATSIRAVLQKLIKGRVSGLEIIKTNGKSILLDFFPYSSSRIIPFVLNLPLPSFSVIQKALISSSLGSNFGLQLINDATTKWLSSKITNFQYLLMINILGGRSYHSQDLYPIMPNPLDYIVFPAISNCEDKSKKNSSNGLPLPQNEKQFLKLSMLFKSEEKQGFINKTMTRSDSGSLSSEKTIIKPQIWFKYLHGFEFFFSKEKESSNPIKVELDLQTSEMSDIGLNEDDVSSTIEADPESTDSMFEDYKNFSLLFESHKYELIPEFFSLGECFIGIPIDFLPFSLRSASEPQKTVKLAENLEDQTTTIKEAFDFVYYMRNELESPRVTNSLPKWIDSVFGYQQEENNSIAPLFNKPHPSKSKSLYLNARLLSFPLGIQILEFASIVIDSPKQILLYLIGSHDTFDIINLDFSNEVTNANDKSDPNQKPESLSNEKANSIQRIKTNVMIDHDIHNSSNVFVPIKNGFGFVDSKQSKIFFVNGTDISIQYLPLHPISHVFSTSSNLITISPEGYASNYIISPEKKKILTKVNDYDLGIESPTCVYAQEKKMRIVFGVASGKCIIYSFSGKKEIEIDLNGKIPKLVLISKSWGFIVIYCQGWIGLYSINGTKINEIDITFEISQWNSWSSESGIDYVLCSTDSGNIFVFEAFKLNFNEVVNFHEKIISMKPSKKLGGSLILLHSGDVAFVPFFQLLN